MRRHPRLHYCADSVCGHDDGRNLDTCAGQILMEFQAGYLRHLEVDNQTFRPCQACKEAIPLRLTTTAPPCSIRSKLRARPDGFNITEINQTVKFAVAIVNELLSAIWLPNSTANAEVLYSAREKNRFAAGSASSRIRQPPNEGYDFADFRKETQG